MDFCTRIKQIRLSTGMTRKQFCAYFDIPYRTVTEWERGTRSRSALCPQFTGILRDP